MIGIDIGGANLKIVAGSDVHIHYCPLWRESHLVDILAKYRGTDAAVVMSGELADGFFNKIEGITYIVRSVLQIFPDALFYGIDGSFHTEICPELAAANWVASVGYLREIYPNGVLLDIGSTTADIIPLAKFQELQGMTDILRLQLGYLVYTGMLRTPIATLVNSAVIDGVATPFSTEYFACSGDAHYILGHITDAEYTTATPDGKNVTHEACLRRLARTVCADLEEIGELGAVAVAQAFWEAQRTLVCAAVAKVVADTVPDDVLVGGIGSSMFSSLLGGTDLTAVIGTQAIALPAFAVRELAKNHIK
ncbi:MAG: H4MPT-linked C1 transfer pathway protein [Methanocalculaceae archaeon]|jgi:probable H4MPT-linked C1 transfer pathway protein|nr:H4MPT-linked C1 transfer pathway protein [Methanocalculaceae archaeon]